MADAQGLRGKARAVALPGLRAGEAEPVAGWPGRALDWLKLRFAEEAEAGRPALWLPVALGAGVAVYFSAANEPETWAACATAGLAFMLAFALQTRFLAFWLALALAFVAGGFLAAKLATVRAASPVLDRPLTAEAVGRVVEIEPRSRGMRRVTIEVEALGRLSAAERPARARFTLGAAPAFAAGDRVSLTAHWHPPQGPVRPGGYDFARVAYFERIGATGAWPKDVRALGPALDQGLAANAAAALERLRDRLTRRVTSAVGGAEGTVAAALVTGVQGPIPQDVENDLRAAGLSHILSISGLHMALFAGTLFWLTRGLLALSPHAALRWPLKSVAAAVALAGATFYLALSGAEVATQRSYVMIAVAFVAIMIGRPALAPRNFMIAALIVLVWAPEALTGPSFQMSFAAVAGLIAWFESRRDCASAPPPQSFGGRIASRLLAAVTIALMTTLVAGLATAPFAAYHFHRVTAYALVGNALAEPLIALLVMPAVVGGLLFAPLGLDAPWWRLMGLGLEGVLAIARMVAAWPGSERAVLAFGQNALMLFALGIAWICLWRGALRWGGVPLLASALALAAVHAPPDVVIDPTGRMAAVRGPDGVLRLLGGRPGDFAAKVWFAADAAEVPKGATSQDVRCDRYGCVAPIRGGGLAALAWDPRALQEDCRRAVLVVTRLDAPSACAEGAAVVDRRVLAASGSLALTRDRDGPAFDGEPSRDPAGRRPWSGPRLFTDAPGDAIRMRFEPRRSPAANASAAPPPDPTEVGEDAPTDDQ